VISIMGLMGIAASAKVSSPKHRGAAGGAERES
jgi:hypothetical protein